MDTSITQWLFKKSYANYGLITQWGGSVGCACCQVVFTAGQVTEYTTERDGALTALCPNCTIDALYLEACVLAWKSPDPDQIFNAWSSGCFPPASIQQWQEFLQACNDRMFNPHGKDSEGPQ